MITTGVVTGAPSVELIVSEDSRVAFKSGKFSFGASRMKGSTVVTDTASDTESGNDNPSFITQLICKT